MHKNIILNKIKNLGACTLGLETFNKIIAESKKSRWDMEKKHLADCESKLVDSSIKWTEILVCQPDIDTDGQTMRMFQRLTQTHTQLTFAQFGLVHKNS